MFLRDNQATAVMTYMSARNKQWNGEKVFYMKHYDTINSGTKGKKDGRI